MNVYAVDKLMAEARRLAAEYRRMTGKTLPISGEIAIHDAVRLLGLQPASAGAAGHDAVRRQDGGEELLQIKARVVFDETKGAHRLGELKLDRPWDTLVVVLMDQHYEPFEIYEVARPVVEAALEDRGSRKKGTLSVPRIRIIGRLAWARDGGEAARAAGA